MPNGPTTKAVTRLFSWLRQGLHAGVSAAQPAPQDGHLAVPIRLRVNAAQDIDVPVRLYGPGDVTGIDPREVIRTEPHNLVTDFEPNYFPLMEFDRPDFPWMFSPVVADSAGHLQPWICLVTVEQARASVTTAPNRPLPVLSCSLTELPNLAEAWSWAHAQIVEGTAQIMDPALDEAAQKARLSEFLRRSPERTLSRLLSPRRLDPNTSYYACLVPAFAAGRKAGLGEAVTAEDERNLKPAWPLEPGENGGDSIRLPVYFHWEFRTGTQGDFEALARRLEQRKLPSSLGLRPMNIRTPGWGMPEPPPEAPGTVLGLEGALRTLETESTPWPDETRAPFQAALREILDAPAEQAGPEGEPSLVGPPLYGQWHAKQRTVPEGENAPHWFRELNLDPRDRVAAGFGTQVVRFEQEQLMASAWEQLAKHEQDVQRLKRAQLSEAVGQALSEKHLGSLSLESFLQITAPVRSVIGATRDVRTASALEAPGPVASAAFRRIARRRGPVGRRVAITARQGTTPRELAGTIRMRTAAPGGAMRPRAAVVPLETARAAMLRELQPSAAVLAAVRRDIPEAESTDLVQFAPEFPRPMYETLRDYFPDALLPGMDQVPPNTISLLKTNPRFIEAYLVGLNHEIGREFLWRGFPADQRTTCFRQFWDTLGRVPIPAPEELESLKDIKPITEWDPAAHLGENAGGGGTEGQMVLLIRGDLLRRYPRAMVYALEAVWSTDKTRRELGTEERYPIFRATRAPEITMLGFPLTEEQVRGAETAEEGHAGWFFVLQEQPTETRFGLDVATTFGGVPEHWRDLTWGHLAADETGLKQLVYIPTGGLLEGKTLDNVPWGKNSAHMAFITRQRPFRIAIHARTWMPGTP